MQHATIVGVVPHGMETIDCAVLAHGAHEDAVGHLDAADAERREDLGDGLSILSLLIQGLAWRCLLGWCEVGNALGGLGVEEVPVTDRRNFRRHFGYACGQVAQRWEILTARNYWARIAPGLSPSIYPLEKLRHGMPGPHCFVSGLLYLILFGFRAFRRWGRWDTAAGHL